MIKLTKFSSNDIPRLISWVPDARSVLQWAGPTYTFDQLEDNLTSAVTESIKQSPTIYMFNALDTESNKIVGHTQLLKIDFDKKEGRIGKVLICKEYRGQNFGTNMVEEIIAFAFENLSLNRLTLAVYELNLPAIKVYESLGFEKIFLNLDAVTFNDEKWNAFEMEKLIK